MGQRGMMIVDQRELSEELLEPDGMRVEDLNKIQMEFLVRRFVCTPSGEKAEPRPWALASKNEERRGGAIR